MQLRRVGVLGGGPGGLYAARLLKLARPSCDVIVYEQGEPGTTFGFGVGLAAGTQRNLAAADPDTLRDIVAAGCRHDMTMQVGDRVVRVHNDRLIGIARTELLAVLQRHAEKAGVRLEFGARRGAGDVDADTVIAADGISSATREDGDFGGTIEAGRGLYLWCGTDFALADAVFAPAETEHGTFVTHAYPYSGGQSTFLIETDEQTWRRAGFEATTEQTPSDASDLSSLRYLQQVFAGQLGGHALIGNRTRWTRFRTVRCQRWSSEPDRAARRRRAHRSLLHRLRHQAGHGRRDRTGRGDGRGAGRGWRVRAVRGRPPPARGAAAGTGAAQPAVVGVIPVSPERPGRAADGRLHDPGRERAARPLRRHQPGGPRERPGPVRRPRPGNLAVARRHNQLGPGPAAAPPGQAVAGPGARARLVRYRCAAITDVVSDPWGPAGDAVVTRARRARAGRGGRVPLHRTGRPPLAADAGWTWPNGSGPRPAVSSS